MSDRQPETMNQAARSAWPRKHLPSQAGRRQLPSFLLFASVVLLLNLCPPFQLDFESTRTRQQQEGATSLQPPVGTQVADQNSRHHQYLTYVHTSLEFIKLMFRNPMRMSTRVTRSTLAEARVLGKMAKVWYIKKKIKKLSKKLKKHTIAVPVFTAIPIYEHSYYPQPHITHVSHGPMHHHAAASSYVPSITTSAAGATSAQQQLATSATSQHQVAAYRMSPPGGHHSHPSGGMYHPQAAGSQHIINAYTPSQPLFVDDAGGLYGHYGNAYGRYDGGYHIW